MKRIAIVVYSNYDRDLRIIREAEALRDFGYEPHVYCCLVDKNDQKRVYGLNGIAVNKTADLLWYVPKNISVFKAFFQMKRNILQEAGRFDAIHCHDVNAALVGQAVSKKLSIPLICDFHELFVDYLKDHGARRGFLRAIALRMLSRFWERIGRRIASQAEAFITVNEALASIYLQRWGLERRPLVLHNYNSAAQKGKSLERSYFREKFGIPTERKLLIFQGGLNLDKGIEVILEAFCDQEEFAVVFLGDGGLRPLIEQQCRSHPGKFYWHAPVPGRDIVSYTRCADAGLAPIGNEKPNHVYSSPNKVFEYLAAGIPFACSDLPEMSKIAMDSGAGIVVQVGNAGALYKAARQIFESEAKYKMLCRRAIQSFEQKYCWENESSKLKEIYAQLIGE